MPRTIAFWVGAAAVAFGVGVHLVLFFRMADMGYHLAGMPMDGAMVGGMFAIVAGLGLAAFGLVAGASPSPSAAQPPASVGSPALSRSHTLLLIALTFAMVIDVMKPATLAFVAPGMMREYHITKSVVALLPLFALTGTVVGSIFWGIAADAFGRRNAILFAALMFAGTAICGTMPSFAWNLGMCFLMGMPAGGMVPVAFATVTETLPARGRRFYVVLLAGLGTAGGYAAASGTAYLLEPHFGWRVLWLVGLPTGLILIALSRFIPESPLFGSVASRRESVRPKTPGLSMWLNACALAWSTFNFGFLFWLPASLRAFGWSAASTDGLLARSALVAIASIPFIAWLYQNVDARAIILGLASLQGIFLFAFAAFVRTPDAFGAATASVLIAGLLIAANGFICILLPYAAETFPTRGRAVGTGMVAGSSKIGGLLPLLVAKFGIVPTPATSAIVSGTLLLVSAAGLVSALRLETSGRQRARPNKAIAEKHGAQQ